MQPQEAVSGKTIWAGVFLLLPVILALMTGWKTNMIVFMGHG